MEKGKHNTPNPPDESFMTRALELAVRGLGAVEPNPMVGAVIVRDGLELAAGWHRRFGGPHAEREALAAAAAAGVDVRGATMYVTLEPCSHYGKTPPCTDAVIAAGIARVVAAMVDPDERVSGRGIALLRHAGVQVDVGVCEPAARRLLGPYIKLRTQHRPWVICKWAQTADGYLALPPGAGRWLSGEASRARVQELRAVCDGVCVGIGTVLADDPLLTNRSGAGRQPARLVLDAHLRTPPTCQLVQSAARGTGILPVGPMGVPPMQTELGFHGRDGRGTHGQDARATSEPPQRAASPGPVIVATTAVALAAEPARAEALRAAGVELLVLPSAASGGVDLGALLDELGRRQWTRLLVEGGAAVLRSVVHGGLADELWAFLTPHRVGDAAADLPRFGVDELAEGWSPCDPPDERLGDDLLLRFRRTD